MSMTVGRRTICPQCRRTRFIPHSTAPYCTRSCERDAERHSESWYSELASALGHRGFVTLAEIRNAERTGWQPEDHSHEFQGQKLVHAHAHAGGNRPHGYFEHPEDGVR